MTSSSYFGDFRDKLEAIYPTCSSFVRTEIPSSANWSIEVMFDATKEEERTLFSQLCYAYEDSCDWNAIPLVARESSERAMRWRSKGAIVKQCSFDEGVTRFDVITREAKKEPNQPPEPTPLKRQASS